MAVGQKDFAEKRPDQLVYLEIGSGNGGMLLSISESGFRFRAVAAMHANGPVPFAFSLDGSNRLEGTGEIDWLEDDGKSGGLRFTDVSADFRASVRRWLTGSGLPAPSPREYAPAATKPIDTLEKIRQELRSGYPTSRKPQSPPITESETAPKRKQTPANVGEASAISRTHQTESVIAPSMFSGRVAEPTETDKEPATSSSISSAFLKPRRESQPSFHPSPFVTQPESLPEFLEPEVALHSEEIHEAPAPVADEPRLVPAIPKEEPRPYVPPLEESFEDAWQRAKLSTQPEPSRLSRAAASSIIALALCVILGALGYNYRQDIGSFVIDLGQKISGDKSAPSGTGSPTTVTAQNQAIPAASGNSEENTATQSSPPESDSHAADLQQTAAPPQPSASSTAPDAVDPKTTAGTSPESSKIPDASENNNASTVKNLSRPSPSITNKPVTNNIPSPTTKAPSNAAAQPPIEAAAKTGAAIESETGQTEFNLAREILRSNGRQRDLSKAVDLLWNGVKKGYVPAEVALADLYLRGYGVEKSCDQARILLVAASKKGSPDARQKLEQLAEQGCK